MTEGLVINTASARIDFIPNTPRSEASSPRGPHQVPLDGDMYSRTLLPGGHSVGVPPDPIPNSAVKPDCANGTTAQAVEE